MIIGYYNIANFITLTGMSSALCACYLAFMGHYKAAIVVYMLAGLCDLFDGRVARATDNGDMKRRTFGVQIDTVSDVISFGVAPGVLAYAMGFRDVADVVIYIIFACLGAIRLAYALGVQSGIRYNRHFVCHQCKDKKTGQRIRDLLCVFNDRLPDRTALYR